MGTMPRLILTANGLTSPSLQAEFKRMLGADPSSTSVWYIPTAPLRDGMSARFVDQQVAMLKRTFNLSRVHVIDPEYCTPEALEKQVTAAAPGVIWAEAMLKILTLLPALT